MEEYAKEHDLLYINFLELQEETGLDFMTDTYDAGLHLNLSGAEKITRYFGNVLREQEGIEDRRNEEHLSKIWAEKQRLYEKARDDQYEALNGG